MHFIFRGEPPTPLTVISLNNMGNRNIFTFGAYIFLSVCRFWFRDKFMAGWSRVIFLDFPLINEIQVYFDRERFSIFLQWHTHFDGFSQLSSSAVDISKRGLFAFDEKITVTPGIIETWLIYRHPKYKIQKPKVEMDSLRLIL